MPTSVKNFGVTELELTGLLVNIHRSMQLLHNWYSEVLVDHKAFEYMVKSKTETPTTRLKTLLLKLSKYTIHLKYQKGSEMHTSNTLMTHSYSHWVDNLYVHKTKDYDMTQVERNAVDHLNKRLDLTLLRSQLQTHALYDLNQCIKIPK